MITINPTSFGWLITFEWLRRSNALRVPPSVHSSTGRNSHELEGDLAKVRAIAYDIVLNGYELGGGSLFVSTKDLQERNMSTLGFSAEEANDQFGFLLEAMDYGFPPRWFGHRS